MTTFADFKGTLPYASELFGIFQPLLGWKSRRTRDRYDRFRRQFRLLPPIGTVTGDPGASIKMAEEPFEMRGLTGLEEAKIQRLRPASFDAKPRRRVAPAIDSVVARLIAEKLPATPPTNWSAVVGGDKMAEALQEVAHVVTTPKLLEENPVVADYVQTFLGRARANGGIQAALQAMFDRESAVAGYVKHSGTYSPSTLKDMFYQQPKMIAELAERMWFEDPLLSFGENAYTAILSPIGVIHLFREYFFEFDSFLGPPVGHTWISPGSEVELIEINTRKVFTERTIELLTEKTLRTELVTTTQDDLAEAVKEENKNDVKLGFANVARYSSPFFQDTATATFSLDNAKTQSRETTHKQMRLQSEKLASEIKQSFKTTFKTTTEVTDTSSKRYLLRNESGETKNFELRRKMRKVGVQVQDIATQLCWFTFVDDPGRELGIAKLVHIAKPPDLTDLSQPDQLDRPGTFTEPRPITIHFRGIDTDDTSLAYQDGYETDAGGWIPVGMGFVPSDDADQIDPNCPQQVDTKQTGFTLVDVTLDPQGADAQLSVRDLVSVEGSSKGSFTVHLDYVNWKDQSSFPITATCYWAPGQELVDAVTDENKKRIEKYNIDRALRFREAFYEAARDRIKVASEIQARPAEELREEERVVIYRALIDQLMSVGTGSKHVISELVRSIFDVDKLLYFVAPEWWVPRLHESAQHLGKVPSIPKPSSSGSFEGSSIKGISLAALTKEAMSGTVVEAPGPDEGTSIPREDIVDWGGARESDRDNYYITEESEPARLGSSLGWLLELDGDNLRNALLNSPWVKAVIPIRIGKEEAAINWLKQAHVEGEDGFDAKYAAAPNDPPELQSKPGNKVTVGDALDYLIKKIQEFNDKSSTPITPNPADPEDPRNHFAGSLPTEAVFEHGFYPLAGGVKFDGSGTEQQIFSQWMEILPTDQVVALEVEYDPKTLQLKVP